jgi:hypothetical protein
MVALTPKSQPRNSVAVNTFIPPFIPRFYRKALGAALGAVVAGLALTGGQAKALVVTVNGQDWDVTTFTGSYNDNVSKFNTLENGGSMPWWGDGTLAGLFAGEFAPAVDFSGLPRAPGTIAGPAFAFGTGVDTFMYIIGRDGFVLLGTVEVLPPNVRSVTYATAALASSPPAVSSTASVPGPLPILGLAAAFGFSRKLRKRIKLHKGTSDISASTGS